MLKFDIRSIIVGSFALCCLASHAMQYESTDLIYVVEDKKIALHEKVAKAAFDYYLYGSESRGLVQKINFEFEGLTYSVELRRDDEDRVILKDMISEREAEVFLYPRGGRPISFNAVMN